MSRTVRKQYTVTLTESTVNEAMFREMREALRSKRLPRPLSQVVEDSLTASRHRSPPAAGKPGVVDFTETQDAPSAPKEST